MAVAAGSVFSASCMAAMMHCSDAGPPRSVAAQSMVWARGPALVRIAVAKTVRAIRRAELLKRCCIAGVASYSVRVVPPAIGIAMHREIQLGSFFGFCGLTGSYAKIEQ